MNDLFRLHGRTFQKLNDEVILDISHSEFVYGEPYFEEYKSRTNTVIGRKLLSQRKTYAERFVNNGKILDYGCGYGEIVVSDNSKRWFGYDIMNASRQRLGNKFDDKISDYDVVCMFDVLEHLPSPLSVIQQIKAKLIITMPIWNNFNDLESLKLWKHWKPDEHLLYCSSNGLIRLIEDAGYRLLDHNDTESAVRLNIHTFCFERITA